jgi:hypothetical protein
LGREHGRAFQAAVCGEADESMRKDIYGKVENGIETPEHAVMRMREWLIVIGDVCVDYDGYRTAGGLMSLIDDIRSMTLLAIDGASPYVAE